VDHGLDPFRELGPEGVEFLKQGAVFFLAQLAAKLTAVSISSL
jgi:hypothetical protein